MAGPEGWPEAGSQRRAHGERSRFRLISGRSAVLLQARSNVGPIAFGATGIEGWVELVFDGDAVSTDPCPSAHLSVDLNTLRSGKPLYDAELLRRVDARRHPTTEVNLCEAVRIGCSDRYQVTGDLTFHDITRSITGAIAVSVPAPGRILVSGEQVFDIRDFDIAAPSVLLLRIYPDVRVQLQLEAETTVAMATDGS